MSVEKCEMCHPGMPVMSVDEINTALVGLEGWSYDESNNAIVRTFVFKGFYKTMAFVNAVAYVANQQKHHPDMEVSYNTAVIYFQTHEAGGVTTNDTLCAKLVNSLEPECV